MLTQLFEPAYRKLPLDKIGKKKVSPNPIGVKNLLPQKLTLKKVKIAATSKIKVLQKASKQLLRISKGSVVAFLVLYLMGYQPVFAIPPLKKSIVKAEFSQNQAINSSSLTESFALPHPGYISTYFSAWHPGVDIATDLGTAIHPVASGVVAQVTYGFWGLGHNVTIRHSGDFESTYGHMGRIFVKVGDSVSKETIIGEVGLTGHTTGPHTHLEITKDGQYIDPLTLLPQLPDLANAWRF